MASQARMKVAASSPIVVAIGRSPDLAKGYQSMTVLARGMSGLFRIGWFGNIFGITSNTRTWDIPILPHLSGHKRSSAG